MRHEWSLFGLHRLISLEEQLTELKDLLGSNLNVDSTAIDDHRIRIDLVQEQEDGINQFTMFFDGRMRLPMVLCYTGADQWIHLFCSWLKSQGVIIWPVELDTQAMLQIADTIVGMQCYDTKFVFDVVTTDRNLKKMELEVDKASFRRLTSELKSPTALQESIVPYIYQRSGMLLDQLPLTIISFTGAASVTHSRIVLSSWSSDILNKLLGLIQ